MPSTIALMTRRAMLTLAAAACLASAGCNIVGPAVVALSPPPTNEAQFILPQRTTVVFVDDRRNVLPDRRARVLIGDMVASNLMAAEALTDTIQSTAALRAAGEERQGQLKSLEQIGTDIGAAVLISVEMTSYFIGVDQGIPRAAGSAQIKVIDCENRVRLFPVYGSDTDPNATTHYVSAELPVEEVVRSGSSEASARELESLLTTMLADKIAKVFYEHEVRPLGPQKPREASLN
jgi:hypothetical protein